MKITLSRVCSIYLESILAATLCKCHEYCIYQNAGEVVSITDLNMLDVIRTCRVNFVCVPIVKYTKAKCCESTLLDFIG